MTKWRNFGLAVLVLTLGFTVGCGDKEAATPTSTGDAGTNNASTEPEEDIFVAKSDDIDELNKVGAMLDIKLEDVGEIERHRGAGDDLVTLYWPQDNVTKEGLQTYRVDVGDDYEDDGKLEFRVGKKVLYSEQFAPEDSVTVSAVPQSVIDAIKKGKTVTWGVFFEGRAKKNSVKEKFKVVDGKKAGKRLKKMEGSKHFTRQKALIQELLKTQVLEDNRLYSEALVQYLGILQAWPDSTQPFRGIVSCCRRLKLKDTPLFTIASEFVRGKGGRAKAGNNSGTNPVASGGSSQIALRGPSFQNRGPDGFRPTQLGAHGGTPGKTDGPTGTGGPETPAAQPGSMGADKATRERLGAQAQKLQDAADTRQREAQGLGQALKEFERLEGALAEAERNVEDAAKNYEAAKKAYDDVVARQGTANPPKGDELERARQEMDGAHAQARQAGEDAARERHQLEQHQAALGRSKEELKNDVERAEYEANKLAEAATKARNAFEMETGSPAERAALSEAARKADADAKLAEYQQVVNEAQDKVHSAQSKVLGLQQQIEAAKAAQAKGTSGTAAEQELAGRLPDLLQELNDAVSEAGAAKDAARKLEDALSEMTGN